MKKSLILLLIFMFISNLIKPINAYNTNISTKKDTDNSTLVIDKTVNYNLYIKGIIVALNDHEALNDLIQIKMIYYVSGYNDNDDYASLTYDYVDISNVNLQKAGTHPACTKLKLMDDCVDDFVLADNINLLKLKKNDIFSIEIDKINDYHFKLGVTLNGKKIDQLKDMRIMVPYTLNKKINTVAIIGPNNEKTTSTYDASSKLVTFIADYLGTYKIEHKQTCKDNNSFNYLPLIISTNLIICLISFLLIKRGKNYAKKIY